ncbi:hypothetical protein PM082_000258 [Marasmius tenuissimus]|nr:hypothetical protein PM082_000258 [Marasmius tenuissimus]
MRLVQAKAADDQGQDQRKRRSSMKRRVSKMAMRATKDRRSLMVATRNASRNMVINIVMKNPSCGIMDYN